MDDPTTEPTRAQDRGPVTDALTKWRAEAGCGSVCFEELRLDANERLAIPFTTSVEEVAVHYLDYPSLRGYVRCHGTGCLLCRIGRQPDVRDLLPVYHVIGQARAVLPISPTLPPQALKPQLLPALQRLKAGERVLLALRKIDKLRYSVTTLPLTDDADDGADQVADFLGRVES